MDHLYHGAATDLADDVGVVTRMAKKLDRWALENPYQAAAVGAAVGLAGSILFNRLLLIKGAAAIAGCVYGTIKGAATGYTYPTARNLMEKEFSKNSL